ILLVSSVILVRVWRRSMRAIRARTDSRIGQLPGRHASSAPERSTGRRVPVERTGTWETSDHYRHRGAGRCRSPGDPGALLPGLRGPALYRPGTSVSARRLPLLRVASKFLRTVTRCDRNNRLWQAPAISYKAYAQGSTLVFRKGERGWRSCGRPRNLLYSRIFTSGMDGRMKIADRGQSGRMYLTRNQAYVQAYRGFESHPVRHSFLLFSDFSQYDSSFACWWCASSSNCASVNSSGSGRSASNDSHTSFVFSILAIPAFVRHWRRRLDFLADGVRENTFRRSAAMAVCTQNATRVFLTYQTSYNSASSYSA